MNGEKNEDTAWKMLEDTAWKMLLESLNNQQNEIVRLREREIDLLKYIMRLEAQRRDLTKVISEKIYEKKQEL